MNILQVCTNFPLGGGIQRHVIDLTQYLVDHEHSVSWVGNYGPSVNLCDVEHFDIPLLEVTVDGGSLPRRVRVMLKCAHRLRNVLKSRSVDVIHAHETAPAIVAKIASIGLNIPLVMTYHGSQPEREREAARIARFASDVTLCPSYTSLGKLVSHGLPKRQARVLGLGINTPEETSPQTISSLREQYKIDEQALLIFSLSRLSHQKGIDIMIAVAKALISGGAKVNFVVAGDGPLSDDVQQWVIDAGIQEYITFIGNTVEVSAHLAAADIFLLTSRWEALPISIVEAFKAGLPVVATDCGGVLELVDDSVGQLCNVGDVEGLTAALRELVENPATRKSKGNAARLRGQSDRFDPTHTHEAFLKLYQEVSTQVGRKK